jgi:hypothetical protein
MINPTNTVSSTSGSGTVEVRPTYVVSSIVNDPPNGSPVIITFEMPPAELRPINSFGLLPGSPESASFFENLEVAEATRLKDESKASTVKGFKYVK